MTQKRRILTAQIGCNVSLGPHGTPRPPGFRHSFKLKASDDIIIHDESNHYKCFRSSIRSGAGDSPGGPHSYHANWARRLGWELPEEGKPPRATAPSREQPQFKGPMAEALGHSSTSSEVKISTRVGSGWSWSDDALIGWRYLSNAASFVLCGLRSVTDH